MLPNLRIILLFPPLFSSIYSTYSQKRTAAPVIRPSAQPRAFVAAPLNPLATAAVNGRRKLVKIKAGRK